MQPFLKSSFVRRCSLVLVLVALSATARAQRAPLSLDGAANVGAYSLTPYNFTNNLNNTTHMELGATAGINLIKQIAVVGEFNYLPQGTSTLTGSNYELIYKMAGAAVRYTPFQYKRFAPYLVGGGGYIQLNANLNSGSQPSGTQNGDYVSYGAGVSIYVWHHFGVRPEFRQDREDTSTLSGGGLPGTVRQNANRGTVGVFYEFGGRKSK